MALDRQRILGELGSVMKQLQSADCGCLGKLFGDSQHTTQPMMGDMLPTCGGCRRRCCHGHGYSQYNTAAPMSQPVSNMNYTPIESSNPSQNPMSGNMYGFGPQIVNMMRGDHAKQDMTGESQGQIQGPLTGPMVIDAPQSPHGKVGLMPFAPPAMVQQEQLYPANMNHGDVVGQMQNQLTPQYTPNISNMRPWPQQNMNPNNATNQVQTSQMIPRPQQNTTTNPAAHQMQTPQMNSWSQQNMDSNSGANQTRTPHNNPYDHSEGIAKFNKMFPGVKEGMGGDLGFDPMAIAIQMNPNNHLKSAMDTMNNIMSGNKGMDQMFNKSPEMQRQNIDNTTKQSSQMVNGKVQQNVVLDPVGQDNNNQMTNHQQHMNANPYGQTIPQHNQQIYPTTTDPNSVSQQVYNENNNQQPAHQQYTQQQIINSPTPNLPSIQYEETANDNQLEVSSPEATGYPNQTQQIIKEPIFPVDTSKNLMYMPTKQQNNNYYSYNTLGQPVEMLPAKLFHPPEPTLPQTLSPQPDQVKPKTNPLRVVNVKATVSKTSLMGNKPTGKTPSRSQLQHIYNQYKGSQSYTHQNVRHPGEGTYSDGRLNVTQGTKVPHVPVERVGGDTVVNNPPSKEVQINKVEQVMGQIGDVPVAKPAGDSMPQKEAPVPVRKCRNGLQDVVFSSYPTSAAWTFHGHGRNDHSPPQHYRHRRY